MWLLLVAPALAGRWDGVSADVSATRVVPGAPEQVFSYMLDLRHLESVLPDDCVGRFDMGDRTFGEGASAFVRYDMALMHRKLPMTLVRADAPRYMDFEHVGPKGFTTRWTFEAAEGGTKVTVSTPLLPPPKPFAGYYHKVVQPEWTACYARTLENLSAQLATRAAPSP